MKNITFLYSQKKMPLMSLPVRSTIVSVASGNILISPGSQLTAKQLKKLNNITDIVAPNLWHCAGIPQAAEVFPNARVWGVPGAKEHLPSAKWTDVLTTEAWAYQSELPIVPIEGAPSINEVIFIHLESKSMIATDIVFNLIDPRGIGAWIILKMFGTYKKFGISKLLLRWVTDHEAFRKSFAKIFQFDFENIIMAHGASVEGNAKKCLAYALEEREISVP